MFYTESGVLIEKRMAVELAEEISRFKFSEIFTSVHVISKVLCILFSHLCLVSRVCVLNFTALIRAIPEHVSAFHNMPPHPPSPSPLHPPNFGVRFCMKWSVKVEQMCGQGRI